MRCETTPPFTTPPLVLKSQISNPLSATRKNARSILVTSAHTPVKLSKTMPDSRRPELKQLYTMPSLRQVPARGGRTAILPTAVRTTPWSRRVVYGFLKSGRNRFRQPNLDPPRGDQIRTRIDPPPPRSAVESRQKVECPFFLLQISNLRPVLFRRFARSHRRSAETTCSAPIRAIPLLYPVVHVWSSPRQDIQKKLSAAISPSPRRVEISFLKPLPSLGFDHRKAAARASRGGV